MNHINFIKLILCLVLLINNTSFFIIAPGQANNSTDLELIKFESWWSHLNNGTLYIRYLVNNTGETYYSPNEPFYLEIAFMNNTNQTPLTYVKQPSFLDPNSWFTGETIGGCYQIFNISKPDALIAIVNYNQSIPESNYNNNQQNTLVKNGIIIKGKVTHTLDNKNIASSKVSIRRSNLSTLQSNLFISFSTDIDGNYIVSLYPNDSSQKNDYYPLLFINSETQQTMIKNIPVSNNQQEYFLNISFPDYLIKTPKKPIGRIISIRNLKQRYIGFIMDSNNQEIYFKFQFDYVSYSPWIRANENNRFVVFNHIWKSSGLHQIKVIVKNKNGLLSSWSEPTHVYII